MNIKQILANIFLGSLILFANPALSYAQVNTAVAPEGVKYAISNPGVGTPSSVLKANPTGIANREANLQSRAATEIQRRITSLNELTTKINRLKHLTSVQKSTYATNIQTEVTNLTGLQTKIQGDTDPTTLKTDVQSIITSYRVYALYMPQMRLLIAADSALNVADNLSSLSGKLQVRISTAQSSGQNVAALQTTLNDMMAKIKDANTQANAVITLVTPLTPAGYPGNQSTLMTARTTLTTAIQDLKAAGTDATQVIQGLIVLSAASPTNASNSAVPSSTTSGFQNPAQP